MAEIHLRFDPTSTVLIMIDCWSRRDSPYVMCDVCSALGTHLRRPAHRASGDAVQVAAAQRAVASARYDGIYSVCPGRGFEPRRIA
eukprot:COSAG01_NODE_18429_length_1077_cov_0.871166_2_plen_86_part_00